MCFGIVCWARCCSISKPVIGNIRWLNQQSEKWIMANQISDFSNFLFSSFSLCPLVSNLHFVLASVSSRCHFPFDFVHNDYYYYQFDRQGHGHIVALLFDCRPANVRTHRMDRFARIYERKLVYCAITFLLDNRRGEPGNKENRITKKPFRVLRW